MSAGWRPHGEVKLGRQVSYWLYTTFLIIYGANEAYLFAVWPNPWSWVAIMQGNRLLGGRSQATIHSIKPNLSMRVSLRGWPTPGWQSQAWNQPAITLDRLHDSCCLITKGATNEKAIAREYFRWVCVSFFHWLCNRTKCSIKCSRTWKTQALQQSAVSGR